MASGVLLVLLGLAILLFQLVPSMWGWFNLTLSWPFILIGLGAVLLLFAVVGNIPGMAVPASILAGIGALLYWQNLTGNWESWAYAWTLIPGFVGVGLILMGLLGERPRRSIQSGLWLILISAVLFGIVASPFNALGSLGSYWPLLLILVGVLLLVRSLLKRE